MEGHGPQKAVGADIFKRDAQNLRSSAAVVLIGVKGTMPKKPEKPLNCGGCGYATCAEFIGAPKGKRGEDFIGPLCVFQSIDLGIALGVAVILKNLRQRCDHRDYRVTSFGLWFGDDAFPDGLCDPDRVIVVVLPQDPSAFQ